jgi:hypothetical protein
MQNFHYGYDNSQVQNADRCGNGSLENGAHFLEGLMYAKFAANEDFQLHKGREADQCDIAAPASSMAIVVEFGTAFLKYSAVIFQVL